MVFKGIAIAEDKAGCLIPVPVDGEIDSQRLAENDKASIIVKVSPRIVSMESSLKSD